MSGAEPRILLELRFAARAKELHGVREAVRNAVSSEDRSDAWTQELVSAVDEACQNVIRYAYRETQTGDVELRLERSDDRLVIWLRDFAPSSDPAYLSIPRDLAKVKPGGLGIHLMRELMDEIERVTLPEGDGNLLRMTKYFSRDS